MKKPSASTLLLIIAFLASAVAAVNFYLNFTSERARRLHTESQLQRVTEAKQLLEQERDELTKAKGALEEQVTSLTKRAQEVSEQFAQEKRAREALTAELVQVRKDANQTKSQLESERKEKEGLSSDLGRAKQSYQALSTELTTLRQAKEALEKRVKEMLAARAKEAEQIVVKPAGTAAPSVVPSTTGPSTEPVLSLPKGSGRTEGVVAGPTAVRGEPVEPRAKGVPAPKGPEAKVLVVNREYNFVVLNVGSKDGIRKGSKFSVWRDGKAIVTVEVDKVYDNMAAANLLEEAKKGDVKEGDVARLIS